MIQLCDVNYHFPIASVCAVHLSLALVNPLVHAEWQDTAFETETSDYVSQSLQLGAKTAQKPVKLGLSLQ